MSDTKYLNSKRKVKMNTSKLKLLLGLLALSALLPAAATTVFYNFNNESDLGWNGIVGGANEADWISDGGINSTGAIGREDNSNRQAMVVTSDSFNGSLGDLSMSTFLFLNAGDQDAQGNRRFAFGFKDNDITGQVTQVTGNRFTEADNSLFTFLETDNGGTTESVDIRLGLGLRGNGSGSETSDTFTSVTNNAWYFMETDFNPQATNGEWIMTTRLFGADSSGNISSTLLLSHTDTFTNGPLVENLSEIYGSFALPQSDGSRRRSVELVDDITITAIPEPGTLVLVGIALGSLLFFRRRS